MTTNPAAAHTISHRLRNRLNKGDYSKIIKAGGAGVWLGRRDQFAVWGMIALAGITPSRPARKSSSACCSSSVVFMTNGP